MATTRELVYKIGAKMNGSFGASFGKANATVLKNQQHLVKLAETELRVARANETLIRTGGAEAREELKQAQAALKVAKAEDHHRQSVQRMSSSQEKAVRSTQRLHSSMSGMMKGLIGAASGYLAISGLQAAYEKTIAPAAQFQGYQTSINFWLKGNTKAANAYLKQLDILGAASPFTFDQMMEGAPRALGIEDGNIKNALKLNKIAMDMAALTPGKTIGDAMEAIADAKMGEYERLKEFNLKLSKKTAGDWATTVKMIEAKYKGGAAAYAKTWGGATSTIMSVNSKMFRSFGEGVINQILPYVSKLAAWTTKHPEQVKAMIDTVTAYGKRFGKFLISSVQAVQQWWQQNKGTFIAIGESMLHAYEKAKPTLKWVANVAFPTILKFAVYVLDKVTAISNWVIKHWDTMKWVILGVGTAIVTAKLALKAFTTVDKVLTMIQTIRTLKTAIWGVKGATDAATVSANTLGKSSIFGAGGVLSRFAPFAGSTALGVGSIAMLYEGQRQMKEGIAAGNTAAKASHDARLAQYSRLNNRYSQKEIDALARKEYPGVGGYNSLTVQQMTHLANKYAQHHANGGLVTRQALSWLAEGNKRELVLPLTNQPRTQALLQAHGLGGMNVNLSVTVNGGGLATGVESAVRMTIPEFRRMLAEVMQHRQRVSYAG